MSAMAHHRPTVASIFQGTPDPAETRKLQSRRCDGEAAGRDSRHGQVTVVAVARGRKEVPLRMRWWAFAMATASAANLRFLSFVAASSSRNLTSSRSTAMGTGHRFAFSRRTVFAMLAFALGGWTSASAQAPTPDPLPSWNDRAAKSAIIDFVARVTRETSADFVPAPARIATFDNDGTLWAEQPIYFQFAFAIDRARAIASKRPDWKRRQPFKALLEGDHKALAAAGEKELLTIMAATHSDMTTDDFTKSVNDWIRTARHPRFDRPYTDLVYQPMIELLGYLRANGFKTFIVSAGAVKSMRPWADRGYGIPPEQAVGSPG